MKITRESWVIAALGIADLVTTIVFIEHHGAEEANPLFRHLWEMGLFAFILAKLVLLACPLLVLEWARKRSPRFTLRALRGGIVAYILMYGIGFARLNGPEAHANEVHTFKGGYPVEYSRTLNSASWKLSPGEMRNSPFMEMHKKHMQRMYRESWQRSQQTRNKGKIAEPARRAGRPWRAKPRLADR